MSSRNASSTKPAPTCTTASPKTIVATGLLMTARALVEVEPNYTYVTARLLLDKLRSEAFRFLDIGVAQATQSEMASLYGDALAAFVKRGVKLELLAPELKRFDLKRLGAALKPERDLQFNYLGLQTLYDRYFIHSNDVRFELPQVFFMRVAMGLAIQEDEPEQRAVEFYNLLSSFDYHELDRRRSSTRARCARSSRPAS